MRSSPWVLALLLAGCHKDAPSAPPSSPPPAPVPAPAPVKPPLDAAAPVDAAVAPTPAPRDAPDEASLRKGKRTGLGAADEKPEVLTEDLIRALASGKVDLARFIDPKRPPVEASSVSTPCDDPKDKDCGYKPHGLGKGYLAAMVKAGSAEDERKLTCDNRFAATPDPAWGARDRFGELEDGAKATPARYLTCSVFGGGEWAESFHVLFVPDEARGLRMVAQVSQDVGGRIDWLSLVPALTP
jgi:hypothetical protein